MNESKDTINTRDTTLGILSDFETKLAAPGCVFEIGIRLLPAHTFACVSRDGDIVATAPGHGTIGIEIRNIHTCVAGNGVEFLLGNKGRKGLV